MHADAHGLISETVKSWILAIGKHLLMGLKSVSAPMHVSVMQIGSYPISI